MRSPMKNCSGSLFLLCPCFSGATGPPKSKVLGLSFDEPGMEPGGSSLGGDVPGGCPLAGGGTGWGACGPAGTGCGPLSSIAFAAFRTRPPSGGGGGGGGDGVTSIASRFGGLNRSSALLIPAPTCPANIARSCAFRCRKCIEASCCCCACLAMCAWASRRCCVTSTTTGCRTVASATTLNSWGIEVSCA